MRCVPCQSTGAQTDGAGGGRRCDLGERHLVARDPLDDRRHLLLEEEDEAHEDHGERDLGSGRTCRFRDRGAEYVSKSGMKRAGESAKRECDRAPSRTAP